MGQMGGAGETKNPRESYKTLFFWREAAGCYQRAPKGMIGEISRIKSTDHMPLYPCFPFGQRTHL